MIANRTSALAAAILSGDNQRGRTTPRKTALDKKLKLLEARFTQPLASPSEAASSSHDSHRSFGFSSTPSAHSTIASHRAQIIERNNRFSHWKKLS
jgi:hypothetical protein